MWDYFSAFAQHARRQKIIGIVLLSLAGVIWAVLVYRLFLAPEDSAPDPDGRTTVAASDVKWLAFSVPIAVAGAVQYTSGTLMLRMREYVAEHHEESKMKRG